MVRLVDLLMMATFAYAAPASVKRANESAVDQDLPPVVKANSRAGDANLIQSLLLAPTQKQRINLLNQPGDFLFDFNNPPEGATSTGKGMFNLRSYSSCQSTIANQRQSIGGKLVSANAETFPGLIGNGGAMTVAFLGPCGLNSPHVHNRATELNLPVKGRLVTSFFEENGVTAREDLAETFNLAVFPQG